MLLTTHESPDCIEQLDDKQTDRHTHTHTNTRYCPERKKKKKKCKKSGMQIAALKPDGAECRGRRAKASVTLMLIPSLWTPCHLQYCSSLFSQETLV